MVKDNAVISKKLTNVNSGRHKRGIRYMNMNTENILDSDGLSKFTNIKKAWEYKPNPGAFFDEDKFNQAQQESQVHYFKSNTVVRKKLKKPRYGRHILEYAKNERSEEEIKQYSLSDDERDHEDLVMQYQDNSPILLK